MATSREFIEYVVGQLDPAQDVSFKKMFGEYMVYVNAKPVLLVCDDTVFVKILPCLEDLMRAADRGLPYPSAKEHYILDIDDVRLAREVIALLERNTPLPKPKKARACTHE